jgi:hypothetical protein
MIDGKFADSLPVSDLPLLRALAVVVIRQKKSNAAIIETAKTNNRRTES